MNNLKRKNFFPAVLVDLSFLGFLAAVIFFLDPEKNCLIFGVKIYFNLILFFFFFYLFWGLTLALFLANTRRGFLFAFYLTVLAFLKMKKILFWGNILGLLLFILAVEAIFTRKQKKKRKESFKAGRF